MKQFKNLALVLLFTTGMISCQEEETKLVLSNQEADMEVITEDLLTEIDALTDEVIDLELGWLKSGSIEENVLVVGCPVVTYDRVSLPHTITIDYGTGCEGGDGKIRSGKIIISSTTFENLSVKREKTFDNFYVEGKKIEGKISKAVTFSMEDLTRVAVVEEEISVTFEDNTSLTRKANLTREHYIGIPGIRIDDQTKTWGEAITSRPSGITITKTISEDTPLIFKASCRQIVSGMIVLTNGTASWMIDYGTGECDGIATITRDGESRTVKIGK